MNPNSLRRIVIYRCGSLGDTIVALPALKLVARAFPDVERWLLTNFSTSGKVAPMASVLDGMGLVHGYIEYPAGMRNPRSLWHLRRNIRALGTRTLVYLNEPMGRLHTWRNAAFLWSCGLRHQIGVPWIRDRQQVRQLSASQWEPEAARQARCVESLGDARSGELTSYDIELNATEHAEAERLLAPLTGRTLIGVSVGAKVDTKDWEDARWTSLLQLLAQQFPGYGLVMLGSADETARCQALGASWHGRSLNLSGRLSVRASAAVLTRTAVFVGHDSGPMHLAAAVGTRCVAIFSSRNLPGQWFPCGEGHQVLYQPMPCQGCRLDVCVQNKKACIRSISVDTVFNAVVKTLASPSSGATVSLPKTAKTD